MSAQVPPRTRRPQDVTAFERRCASASDAQILAVQTRLRLCADAATSEVPKGEPTNFLRAIDSLRTSPQMMLDVAPEFRGIVEMALSAVGVPQAIGATQTHELGKGA